MIIVNFATKEFLRGQLRLADSIKGYKFLALRDYGSIGSPTHQQSPYEFKIHSIKKAFELDDIVLWMDASMIVKGDLSKIETIIKRDGYFMEEAGHYVGRWCNDFTKSYFKLSDQEAHQGAGGITMFSAGLLGLNLETNLASEFLGQWYASAKAGCFKGDWSNHRHDMTCASIIATRLGMKYQPGASHLCYVGPGYSKPHDEAIVYCQGLV